MPEPKKTMKADGKIALWLAFVGWLVLLALPLLVLHYSFLAYADFIFQRKVSAKKQFLHNELYAFIDDLSVQNFLQRNFNSFNQNFDFSGKNAQTIKAELEKHLQAKVAVLIKNGSDGIQVAMMNIRKMDFVAPPRIFLKRFFKMQNNPDQASSKENIAEKTLFRSFFGNITEIDLPVGKVMKSISAKFGHTGPIYYHYFSDLRYKVDYLAIVREQDIRPGQVIKDAMTRGNIDFKRTFSRSNRKLKFPQPDDSPGFSDFIESDDKVEVKTILPVRNFVHLVQRGTIVPLRFGENFNNVPVIGVSLIREKLGGRLVVFKKRFKFFSLALFLLGTMLFFRIALFGIDFHLQVSTKVFASLFLAAMFPVLIFIFAYSAFVEYGQINEMQLAQQMLQQKIAVLRKHLNSGINQIELENVRLAMEIENEKSVSGRKALLKRAVDNDLAQVGYYQELSGDRDVIASQKLTAAERWHDHEMRAFEIFVHQMLEVVRTSPHLIEKANSLSKILTDIVSNRTSANNVLKSSGKLQSIDKLTNKFWFACMIIFNDELKRQPETFILPGFLKKRFMQQQLKKVVALLDLSEKQAGFQIDLALALKEDKEIRLSPEYFSLALNAEEVQGKMRLAELLKRELIWETRNGEGVEIAVYDEALPYLCFARISRLANRNDIEMIESLAVVFYLFLLAIMVFMVADMFFVAPVKRIAAGLLEVGAGRIGHRFAPRTGDEFDQLGNSLNGMLRGLVEKEILSEYVSKEVKQAVSQAEGDEFAPGGEMIEATVLFCEPLEFNEFAAASDPEEVIRHLNNFIAIADQSCGKNGGVIDKIIENTLMMVFRDKSAAEFHAMAAARTALELTRQLGQQNADFPFPCKIGIASGPVISGKIGSSIGKLDFTVIGDTVNLAARLKSIAEKAQQSRILLSQQTVQQLGLLAETRCVELVEIKGKTGKYEVFELLQVKSLTKDVI